jgi:hypothetical protein
VLETVRIPGRLVADFDGQLLLARVVSEYEDVNQSSANANRLCEQVNQEDAQGECRHKQRSRCQEETWYVHYNIIVYRTPAGHHHYNQYLGVNKNAIHPSFGGTSQSTTALPVAWSTCKIKRERPTRESHNSVESSRDGAFLNLEGINSRQELGHSS